MSGARWSRLALLALPACLTPSLAPCGDLLCPDGAICVADTVCALPEQLAACAGIADAGSCQTTQGTGHCLAGVCVGNVCGDGVVTGNEVCDGTELTVTCADFGFYAGEPSCTPSCTVDRVGCSGSCGDGVVQTEFDEQCDTAPPGDGCIDFGQDYGVLTCNAFCAPAISRDCERYGWEELLPASVTYTAANANAHGVLGLNPSVVDVTWNGVASTRANPGWTTALANADILVAVGTSSIGWFDGQWHELAFGLSAAWMSLSDDGHLFARTGSQCEISKIDLALGATISLPSPPTSPCSNGVAIASDRLYVPQGFDGVRLWNGNAWSVAHATPADALLRAGPQRIAVLSPSGLRFMDVSAAPVVVGNPRLYDSPDAVAFDDDDNELDLVDGGGQARALLFLRAGSALFELNEVVASDAIARSGDGRLLTVGAGVRAMRPISVAATLPTDTVIESVHRAGDGVIACGQDVFVTGIDGFVQRPFVLPNSVCEEASGDASGAHFILSSGRGVVRYNAGANAYEDLVLGSFSSIAGDFTQLYIAGGSVVRGVTNADANTLVLENAPSGCTITKLAMSAGRRFVGVGVCNQQMAVFERTTAWTTIATSSVGAGPGSPMQIAIGDDNAIFVRIDTDVFRIDGTTFAPIGKGTRIAAVGRDDAFIDQGSDALLHVTGATSEEIRLATGPFAATRNHLFSWDQISRRMYAVARVPSQANGL